MIVVTATRENKMATVIVSEYEHHKPTLDELERDFYAGEHFKLLAGGYVNRWMLRPGVYQIWQLHRGGRRNVTVNAGAHLVELEQLVRAGLGDANGEEIVRLMGLEIFQRVCDLRLCWSRREPKTVNELIEIIKSERREM